jgi:hypothetical protein
LITLTFSAKAAARPRVVWRALTDPALIARWRPGFAGWIGAAPGAIAGPTTLRFRSLLRDVPIVAMQRVLELQRGVRVKSRMRYGLFAFDESFSLRREDGVPGATRVGLALSLANQVALVSGVLDRFTARRIASEIAEQTLTALCATCAEQPPGDEPPT